MSQSKKYDIPRRLRRLRATPAVRALVQETHVSVDDFIMPMFVKEGDGEPESIDSMPGQFRHTVSGLVEECKELSGLGVKAVALFPVTPPEIKDERGTEALNADCLVLRAVKAVKAAVPDLLVITDVALDPYTSHGHDGVLSADGSAVDNDATLEILAMMAVEQAKAGVDWVAPSDMMDGRVRVIREALDNAGHIQTGILAYSVKFASAYYGPFRDAIGSQSAAGKTYLDKSTYQMNPANAREALQEAMLDEQEGADALMVKPAGAYLDVIHALRQSADLPLAAYQVSGEYAQIHAAGERGWLDLKRTRDESLLAIKRAGADMILTYFAKEIAQERK